MWAQEEPRNMGAWSHLLMHLDISKDFRVASRRFYGSPAAGSPKRYVKRHNEVIEYVFNKNKNNFKLNTTKRNLLYDYRNESSITW